MPEPTTVQGAQQAPAHEQDAHASALNAILAAQGKQDEEPDVDEEQDEEQPDADERQLNVYLKKAESAFCKGKKAEILSRVECGHWCHEVYALRQGQDRGFTSTLIFNRLAVHADSQRECDASDLAHLYKSVEILCEPERWKAMGKLTKHPLTIGKLAVLGKLVKRVSGTEVYGVFDLAKLEQAKALFVWACGEGFEKRSIKDITKRVDELLDPVAFAAKEAEQKVKEEQKAKAAKDGTQHASEAEEAEEEEETPAPQNLISTDAARPAAPDWKDVPEGMSAQYNEAMRQAPSEMAMVREGLVSRLAKLPVEDVIGWMTAFFQEGCKRNVGKAHEMLAGFARQLVWTNPMVKGLLDGLADSQDADSAQEALQTIVDTIGEEYGIYPQSELEEKEAA